MTVIGLADPRWVEADTAVIVLKADQSLREGAVIPYCSEHMASVKGPKRVVFTDSHSKSPSGKLLKRELRRSYDKAS